MCAVLTGLRPRKIESELEADSSMVWRTEAMAVSPPQARESHWGTHRGTHRGTLTCILNGF